MSELKPVRAAIYFQMFSPYIISRLNSASELVDLVGIEGARRSAAYDWEPRLGGERFERRTLFSDVSVEEISGASVARALRNELDRADPSVLIAGGWSQPDALTMLLWAREKERPIILMSESTAIDAQRTFLREAVKERIVQQFDAALVGGQPQEDYVATLGLSRDRIFRGYNVVDNDFFHDQSEQARRNAQSIRAKYNLPTHYFLASSRFIEKKNLARLIEAYAAYRARTREKSWDLVLLGDGPLRSALTKQVREHELSSVVHFAGFRQYDELPAYYALASAFCHVSTVEQWGLVVNEAMASGLPLMVSKNCGCAPELVKDGVNGWCIDPCDITQMTKALVRFSDPSRDLAGMGKASRRIIARFHPQSFGDGLSSAVAAVQGAPVKKMSSYDRLLIKALALRSVRTGQ